MTPRAKPYCVVQWATGHLCSESLRQAIDHPDLALAAIFVYSPGKAGTDAGENKAIDRLRGLP